MHVHFAPDPSSLYPVQKTRPAKQLQASQLARPRSSSIASFLVSDGRRASTFSSSSSLRRGSMANVGDDLLQRMPIEGVQRFVQAKAVLVKVLWLALFSLTNVVLIYELCKVVRDFQNSPVATEYTIQTPQAMEFPVIYICNGNTLNGTYLASHLDLLKGVKNVWESVVNARKKRQAITGFEVDEDLDSDDGLTTGVDQQALPGEGYMHFSKHQLQTYAELTAVLSNSLFLMDDSISQQIFGHRNARSATANMKKKWKTKSNADEAKSNHTMSQENSAEDAYNFLIEAGFNAESTFVQCSFESHKNSLDCAKIVQPILDPNNHLCYAVSVPEQLKQRKAGDGLRLLINSHISSYPTKNETIPEKPSGIYVSISKHLDPTNWLKSVVHPGTFTKIDITATKVQLLNLESGSLIQPCVEDGPFPYRVFNTKYSRTACQIDCMLDAFYRYCQCIFLVDKSFIREDILASSTFCSFNASQSCLIPKVTKSKQAFEEINECRKVCHTPCSEWRYKMRSSHAPLHSSRNRNWQLNESIPLKDIIDLRISFPRVEYSEVVQKPSKTIAQLIADFGGHINLWLGASMVSLVHAVAIIFGFCSYGIYSKCFDAFQ